MSWIGNYISEIASFVAGLAGGSLLTLTFTRNRVAGSGSNVDQSRARAGGDIIGRDKNAGRR